MKNRLTRKNKKSFNARGKTLKRHSNYLMVHSTTPMAVEILSKEFKPQKISSYSPTINEKLITLDLSLDLNWLIVTIKPLLK